MLEPKASRFYQAALQSGLIDEAGLVACFDLIPLEKRTPDAIDRRLARQAISTGRLTLWQAQQILGGRSSGFKIDKYLLLDLLGRGGMGRVYLARDLRLNRLVALKILSQERMNNPRAIARFQREAKVGAQLQHENLVRVYDEGESNGVRYLVMEYIEGKNVGQLIGELGAIPWPTAARLGRQIALGLEHARLKELIHRDVNPCNILVTQDGTAKLTDLGLAIDLNDQDNVTREGATVGTFDYVSPEQARHSRSVDTRADIYSLGCTLYHMIAGRVPFPVTSLPEKLYAHQLHDPDPLAEVAPGVPEGLAEVVRKMMRKQPDDRLQTPLEVAHALEPYAVEAGWTATPASSASAALRPRLGVGRGAPDDPRPPGRAGQGHGRDDRRGPVVLGVQPGPQRGLRRPGRRVEHLGIGPGGGRLVLPARPRPRRSARRRPEAQAEVPVRRRHPDRGDRPAPHPRLAQGRQDRGRGRGRRDRVGHRRHAGDPGPVRPRLWRQGGRAARGRGGLEAEAEPTAREGRRCRPVPRRRVRGGQVSGRGDGDGLGPGRRRGDPGRRRHRPPRQRQDDPGRRRLPDPPGGRGHQAGPGREGQGPPADVPGQRQPPPGRG